MIRDSKRHELKNMVFKLFKDLQNNHCKANTRRILLGVQTNVHEELEMEEERRAFIYGIRKMVDRTAKEMQDAESRLQTSNPKLLVGNG